MSMQVIEHIELASAQSSITFSSIPQTYDGLYVLFSGRSNDTSVAGGYDPFLFRFNSSTTGYSARSLVGSGSSASSTSQTTRTSDQAGGTWGRFTNTGIANANFTSNSHSSVSIYVPNYASSNYKSVSLDFVSENNGTSGYQEIIAELWSNTAAITSVSFALGLGSFVQYSSATLYGITAGSDGSTTVS